MEEQNTEWLPHLSNEIVSDAHGYLLDAYAVALEGWRRGLTLRWHVKDSEKFKEMTTWFVDNPGQLFSLSSKDRTHYFFRTRGDRVTNEAVRIGKDKDETKRVLEKAGVAIPEGRRFTDENTTEMMEFANAIGYPVVIKPTDGSFGRGVITNITSSGELEHSLNFIKEKYNYTDMIVERYVPGNEYRLYVVGNQVVGAVHRIPANVQGDGLHSIKALIEQKNEERSLNPRLISCPIQINQDLVNYIGRFGYSLHTVPSHGEQIYLNDKSNISIGGDPIDVLDELSAGVKETAVKAVKAVDGLPHCAVDLIIDSSQKGVIIELNPTAQIGALLYPLKGQARDIPAEIINYYFPETMGQQANKKQAYFDFHDVLDPLQSRDASVTTVTLAPKKKLYMKRYIVSGEVQEIGYHRGLRKQAFERYLHGYVMNLEDGDLEVVVAGTDQEMVNDFKQALWEDEERAQVVDVLEQEHFEPIKVGFEIKTDLKTQIEDLKQFKQDIELLDYAIKRAEVQNRKYHQSLSWRAAKPIRVLGSLFKKTKQS
nr:acylphosphatase [Oceanobacillus manasiensis]